MKKLFILLFLVSLFVSSTRAQFIRQIEDLEKYNFNDSFIAKNRISCIKINSTYNSDSTTTDVLEINFNKNGRITKIITYNHLMKIISESVYKDSLNGNFITRIREDFETGKRDTTIYIKNKKVILFTPINNSSYIYCYNNKNQLDSLIEITCLDNFHSINLQTFTYNSQKKLSRITEKVSNNFIKDTIVSERKIIYNSQSKIIIEQEILNNRINKGNITYEYYKKGNISAVKCTNATSHYYKYLPNNLISTIITHFKDSENSINITDKFSYSFY